MARYVTDYFPAQTGVWITTDRVAKLDRQHLGRRQVCLDEEAAKAVEAAGAWAHVDAEAKINAGDCVLLFDSQEDGEPPLYRELWYGGTPDEYYTRETESRERREAELEECRIRRAQMDRDVCSKGRDVEWRIGGHRD